MNRDTGYTVLLEYGQVYNLPSTFERISAKYCVGGTSSKEKYANWETAVAPESN